MKENAMYCCTAHRSAQYRLSKEEEIKDKRKRDLIKLEKNLEILFKTNILEDLKIRYETKKQDTSFVRITFKSLIEDVRNEGYEFGNNLISRIKKEFSNKYPGEIK